MATVLPGKEHAPIRASDRAHAELKSMILKGTIPPGELINEVPLMEELGVGRTPLREAISRLGAEELVTIVPRRGAFVAELRVSDIQYVFELRLLLEEFCARLAVERITNGEIEELAALLEHPALSEGSEEEATAVDARFHKLLAASTRNAYLQATLERLYNRSLGLLYFSKGVLQSQVQMRTQLAAVLEALRRRDADAAGAAMHHHVQAFRERVRSAL